MKLLCQLFLTCSLPVLLLSCAQEPVTVIKTVPSLRASSIYKRDSVHLYKRQHLNFYEDMAISYLAKAKEAAPVNLLKAIYYTKRAITVYPEKEYYLYLASLLRHTEQAEELSAIYRLLVFSYNTSPGKNEYLFGKPDEHLLYEYMAFELAHDKDYMAGEILYHARNLGFSMEDFKKRLLTDKHLNLRPESDRYKNLMLLLLSDEQLEAYKNSPANFRNFLASMPDSSQVFEIDEQEVKRFDYQTDDWYDEMDFSYLIKEYLPETKETPNKWINFQPKHRVRLNDSIHAVLYAVDTSATACPADMRHIYHRLATYGKKGHLIQSQVVAVQSGEQLSLLSFAGQVFTVTDFSRTWKHPYQKENFDNYVVSKERTGERSYEIRGDGKIYPLEPQTSEL